MSGGGAQNSNQFGQINQLSQLLQHMGAGKSSSMPMATGMSMLAQQPPTPQAPMPRPMMPGGAPQPMTTQAPQMQPMPGTMTGSQGMPQAMLPWQAMMR